jgi:hypothetical protein
MIAVPLAPTPRIARHDDHRTDLNPVRCFNLPAVLDFLRAISSHRCLLKGDHGFSYVGIAYRKDLHHADGRDASLKVDPKIGVVDSAPRQASSCAKTFEVLGVDKEGQPPFLDLALRIAVTRTTRARKCNRL